MFAPVINNWSPWSICYTTTIKGSLETQLLSAVNLAALPIIDLTKDFLLDNSYENWKAEAEQWKTPERWDTLFVSSG